MLYLSKYHYEVNSNRLIPVSIYFCMFVISRGEIFVFKYPTLVIYFDLRKSEFEFTFLLIRQNINFLLSFQKNRKKNIFFVIVSAPRQC